MSAPAKILAAPGTALAGAAGRGAEAPASGGAVAPATCCAIVELRQYTLHPGRFDAFAGLFESTFLEPLEKAGMTVIGQFRDLDDPNRFVWLRGFADMRARAVALSAFYDGTVWKAHRDAANANFTDTDNVLLLHPEPVAAGVALAPQCGAQGAGNGIFVLTVYPLDTRRADAFPAFFAARLRPELERAGIAVAASFATETSPNNFPRLPVREGERVFAWLARFDDARQADAALAALAVAPEWRERVQPDLRGRCIAAPQVLRLQPTARSRLR